MFLSPTVEVGRIIFRQPASLSPPLFHRPWMSTSLHEFCWHQLLRPVFIFFWHPSRWSPIRKAWCRHVRICRIRHRSSHWHVGDGGMGRISSQSEGSSFSWVSVRSWRSRLRGRRGLRVRGWIGWSWAMMWMTLWGMIVIDGWARHGMLANEFFRNEFRPGKKVVDAIIIALSNEQVIVA